MPDNVSEDCWTILNLSPGAELSEIHRAFEQLRLSYLPKDRDRTAPLSDSIQERLQQLDRAFFLAVDSKTTKVALSNTTLTDRLEPKLPVTPQPTVDPSVNAAVEDHAHTEKKNGNLTTTGRTTRFCAICKAPIKSLLAASFCPQCQPAPWNSKITSEQNHSIASDDLVSAHERSRAVGGLTVSFASRANSAARWIAIRIGITLRFVLGLFGQFARLHFGLRAFLGGVLGVAAVWLLNMLGGGPGLTNNAGSNAIFVGVLFGILMKYRWWLFGLVGIFLFERYFH